MSSSDQLFNRLTRLHLQRWAFAEGVQNSITLDCAGAESQVQQFCDNNEDYAFHFLLSLDYYYGANSGVCPNPADCCSGYLGMVCEFYQIANVGANLAISSWT
jgi:hypothetical protein